MTDDFTTAAEDAAERSRDEVLGGPWNGQHDANYIRGFESGAAWARDHLAAQEVTNEEVEATAKSLADDDGLDWTARTTPTGVYRAYARRALTAARTARRDEES